MDRNTKLRVIARKNFYEALERACFDEGAGIITRDQTNEIVNKAIKQYWKDKWGNNNE